MSDLDGLKALNKYGYEVGNAILKAKAEALRESGLDAYHTTECNDSQPVAGST